MPDSITTKKGVTITSDEFVDLYADWARKMRYAGVPDWEIDRVVLEASRAFDRGTNADGIPFFDAATAPLRLQREYDALPDTQKPEGYDAIKEAEKYQNFTLDRLQTSMKEREKSVATQAKSEQAWDEYQRQVEAERIWGLQAVRANDLLEPSIPGTPGAGVTTNPFIQQQMGAGYNLGRFMAGQMPEVVEQFEATHPGAREAWWKVINRRVSPSAQEQLTGMENYNRTQLEGLLRGEAQMAPNPDIPREDFTLPSAEMSQVGNLQDRMLFAQQRLGEMGNETPTPSTVAKDPLLAYIEQYPWYKEFIKLPPRSRGLYTGLTAPMARWR